jgi:hypothetical protein
MSLRSYGLLAAATTIGVAGGGSDAGEFVSCHRRSQPSRLAKTIRPQAAKRSRRNDCANVSMEV